MKQLRESLREARAIAAEEKKRRIALEQRFEAIAGAATRLLGEISEEEQWGEEEEDGADQEREGGDAERELLRRREGDARLSDAKEHDHGDGDANRPEHVRARSSVAVVRREYAVYDDGGDGGDISEEEDEEAQGRGWAGNFWKGLFGSCCPLPGNRDKALLRNVN